jgi:tetratricopeptide (TPR) repeat protein
MPTRRRSRSSCASATGTRRRSRARTWACPASRPCSPVDPANEGALEGITQVYRRAQQWSELGQVLLRRADRAPTPSEAREFPRRGRRSPRDQARRSGARAGSVRADLQRRPRATEGRARRSAHLPEARGHGASRRSSSARPRRCAASEGRDDLPHRGALRGPAQRPPEATRRYEAALASTHEPHGAARARPHLQPQGPLQGAAREPRAAAPARRHAAAEDQPLRAHRRHPRRGVPRPREGRRDLEAILADRRRPRERLSALVIRHYRVLDRWEDVVRLYEKHLKHRHRGQDAASSCSSRWAACSWSRSAPRSARSQGVRARPRSSTRTTRRPRALATCARRRATPTRAVGHRVARREGDDPREQGERWLRAAKMLEGGGDRDGAIERYKKPPSTPQPTTPPPRRAARGLPRPRRRNERRRAHHPRDRRHRRQPRQGPPLRRDGVILREKIKDDKRAEEAATKAVDLDPTNMNGLLVTGDSPSRRERFLEAAKSYESIANRVDACPRRTRIEVLVRYVDALAKTGSPRRPRAWWRRSSRSRPDDPADAVSGAPRASASTRAIRRPRELYQDLLERFGDKLTSTSAPTRCYRLGEARLKARRSRRGRCPRCTRPPTSRPSPPPHRRAVQGLRGEGRLGRGRAPQDAPPRRRDRRRAQHLLLLEIGDILATKLNDRTRAAKSYVAALDERPDDRKLAHQADAALQRGEGLVEAGRGRPQARRRRSTTPSRR